MVCQLLICNFKQKYQDTINLYPDTNSVLIIHDLFCGSVNQNSVCYFIFVVGIPKSKYEVAHMVDYWLGNPVYNPGI